ncbi:hypothetical protein COOONC_01843 [Cooperia oncophora]
MNLYTPANGILETHVTWKDIEQDLQRELFTAAIFGPNKSAQDVEHGNVSDCERFQRFLCANAWNPFDKVHDVPGHSVR